MRDKKKLEELQRISTQYNQDHIWQFWDDLDAGQREQMLRQVESVDFELMELLYQKYKNYQDTRSRSINLNPVDELLSLKKRSSLDEQAAPIGEKALREGKVAAFLVAGGDGTRLGFDGPKGAFPITPVRNKSLFQLHAEKLIAIGRRYHTNMRWYIMTSQSNHQATLAFFEKNHFFGLDKEQIMFFPQQMLPALDENGKLLLNDKHQIFMSPNGHGGSIKALWDSGAIADMQERGIEYLFYFQVDNVLTKICDPVFIGYHIMMQSEMSNKVVRKAFPEEKMGVIGLINGKPGVVEYSDLSEEDMYALDAGGELKYWAGSIAIHVIDIQFIERLNISGFKLPYHRAWKQIPFLDEKGNHIVPENKNGIKFESFVFDALQYANKTVSIEVERGQEFSPVKNREGVDSPQTAQRDLKHLYCSWIKAAGLDFPEMQRCKEIFFLEISPLFAMDAAEFIAKAGQVGELTNGKHIA